MPEKRVDELSIGESLDLAGHFWFDPKSETVEYLLESQVVKELVPEAANMTVVHFESGISVKTPNWVKVET